MRLTLPRATIPIILSLGVVPMFVRAQPAAPAASPAPDVVPADLFSLPDGLEVTVWARSPQLRNPTNIDVDAQGRVWVAEGVNYRRHSGRDPGGDRIVVLEDTNGSGRANQSTVFIQEPTLLAPLGVAVIDNRIVVSNAPDLIVYTDVDRNGKFDPRVDRREVLLNGFNGRNHDHSLHSVTVGPDGKWYFSQGNAAAFFTDRSGRAFRVASTYDPRSSGAVPIFGWKPDELAGAPSDDGHVYVGGFTVRMNPDATDAEVIGFGYRNSYEQCVTSFGDVFQSDNDDPPACRVDFVLEYGNAGFFSRDGHRTWQADRRPGQPVEVAEWRQEDPGVMPAGDIYGAGAPTGMATYESDALGAKWRGMILAGEAGRNTIFGYFPTANGAGFDLKRFDFLTTNKEREFGGLDSLKGKISNELKTWFRPSDVAVGPDGAIYVADWFDPRVGGHQDLDDHMSGAIYRIAPKGVVLTPPKLDLSTIAGQIAALKNPAVNVRAIGFMKLRAAGAAATAAVAELLRDENPFVRARATFLLAQLGAEGVQRVEQELRGDDPRLRLAAFRALCRVSNPQILEAARTLAGDPSPAVRREVAVAMRDVPIARSRDILLELARGYDGHDRTYLEAWGIGCMGKEPEIYAALAAHPPGSDPVRWPESYARLVWRLTPAGAEGAFAARAASAELAEPDRLAAVTALGFIPTRAASSALLDLAEKSTGLVKTQALWWLLNYRSIRWPNDGIDAALKTRGLYDPETITVAASVVPMQPASKLPSVSAIAALVGDAHRGAGLAQACRICHHLGDQGADYAPGLNGFAKNQTTEVVINAIVNPSAEIAHGYEGTELTLRDGTVIDGLILSAGDPTVVESMGGVTQMIPAARIKSRGLMGRSLMLSAEQLGLGAQDVADVVAYLKTL